MDWLDAILGMLGINKAAASTGLVGAAIAALRANAKRLQRFLIFMLGGFVGTLLPPLIVKWGKMEPDPTVYSALGFFLGYFGISLLEAMQNAFDKLRAFDWNETFKSWFKRPGA